MNCPYCSKHIHGMTGFQEAENFQKHLNKCSKEPRSITIKSGNETRKSRAYYTITDALEIKANSGQ
jgi:hypothetical protein